MDDLTGRADDRAPEPEQQPERAMLPDEAPWAEDDLAPEAEYMGEELLPPPGVGGYEEMLPAPERPRRPRRGATVAACLVVALAVLGVMAMALSVKLYLEQRAAVRTLHESVQSMALLSVKLGAPERIQGRLGWLSKAIERGDWQQAQRAAAALRAEDVPAGAGATGLDSTIGGTPDGQLPDPMKIEEFEPGVRVFFAQNTDVWRAFLGFTQAAIKMRDLGINVEDLRALRGQMLEAARLGQKERVSELLRQARKLMESRTGPEAGQGFEQQLKQFARAFMQAQEERRDVAPAGRLAAQAERAARQGDMGRAVKLIGQAMEALKGARRLPGGRGPMRPGMPRMMGPGGPSFAELSFLRFLAGTLNAVMQAERTDLAHVWTQLKTAVGAIREKNQDQIREILDEAIGVMDLINERRTDMSTHIQKTQQRMMQGPPQPEQQGPSREEVVRELRARISAVLADARKMTDEQFEANRQALTAALLEVLMPDQGRPSPDESLSPEQRVRAKMQMISQPYAELKRREVDTTELDGILTQARESIMGHDYARAEELVDSTIPMIQEMLDKSAPPPEEDTATDANPPADDTTPPPTAED